MAGQAKVARIVFAVLACVALGGLLARAFLEVWRGHGTETYETAYGLHVHWISVLTLGAALLVAFIVAVAIRWWQRRDDRTLARVLTQRHRDTQK